jgi:hypothetical protein
MLRPHNAFQALLAASLAAGLTAALPSPAGADFDLTRHLDANTIDVRLSNVGWTGYDEVTGSPGFEFPRGTGRFALFDGGIWLAAKVSGSTRCALAEYATEFCPGPMAGGTFQPDQAGFHVYRVARGDTVGAADWMANAVPQGAPTSAFGAEPAHLGSQTAWAVYNDASPANHVLIGGHTAPLGVEVRQTTWASADNALEDHVIFVRYQVFNRGAAQLDSLYIGLWADPDLGNGIDDLVASDSSLDMAYAYNATNNDAVYGSNPPALAYVLLQGPRPSPGAEPMHASSIIGYINGDDAQSAEESRRMLLGLHRNGSPWINPGTGQPTRFAYSGDPVTGTGWLEPNPTDQRFLLACGPLTMAPGDSQDVVMAMVAAQSVDRLSSITLLRSYVTGLRQVVGVPPAVPPPVARLALAPLVSPARGPVRMLLSAPAGASWSLEVFDAAGRRVARVARGTGTGASQAASWDAAGGGVAPGVYWVVASAAGERASRRVVVLSR